MENLSGFAKKIRFCLRCWRLLNIRQVLYFPHVLSEKEKRFLVITGCVILFSGVWLGARIYGSMTVPVPALGGTYREGLLKSPQYINPIFAANDSDRDISRLIFSSLFTYSGEGTLQNDLVDRYDVSEEGKIYTLELRKDVRWHDGTPLTADDVLFTITLLQNQKFKSPLQVNWQGVTLEKIDTHRIKFTLRTPYFPFIENLTVGILPKHLWENVSPETTLLNELNLRPVGSGPYRFDGIESAKNGAVIRYQLARNPRYYRQGPYLKKIEFLFAKNEDDLASLWKKGKIDGFGAVPPTFIKELSGEKNHLYSVYMPRLFGLFFNPQKSKLLAEPSLRRAIAHALNKETTASLIATSGATPIESPFPIGTPGYNKDVSTYAFDPQKSRELLEAAGWKDEDGDGIREKKIREKNNTEVVPLRLILTTSDWPDLAKTADAIRIALAEVGISVTVKKRELADLEASVIHPRDFEMLLFGHVYGYEPDPFAFWHSSQIKDPGLNITAYSNRRVDQLLESARKKSDASIRAKDYEEVQRLIAQDLPAVFLYSQIYHYLLPTEMKGVTLGKISLPSDRFNEMYLWYMHTRRVSR